MEDDISEAVLPRLGWVVESNGILLLGSADSTPHFIPYPEAAIWDLLARGYARDRIVVMMEAIAGVPRKETEEMIVRVETVLF